MKHYLMRAVGTAALLAGLVAAASYAHADLNIRTHYRCWDNTLRVSHGGWVSYYNMAADNCRIALQYYPNNQMWVTSEQY